MLYVVDTISIFVHLVDIFGEAVDDASDRSGIEKGHRGAAGQKVGFEADSKSWGGSRPENVVQQLLVQPDRGPERPHGDGEDGDEDGERLQEAQHAVDR